MIETIKEELHRLLYLENTVNDTLDEISLKKQLYLLLRECIKDKEYEVVLADIKAVKTACGQALLKVIIETCHLTDEEKRKACELSKEAGADFVKTSTGFSTGGAKAEDVALMRKTVGDSMGVKASGGIRDKETAEAMLAAGASRLGTSATIKICE